jgi:hypothetical protein
MDRRSYTRAIREQLDAFAARAGDETLPRTAPGP